MAVGERVQSVVVVAASSLLTKFGFFSAAVCLPQKPTAE